MFRLSPLSWSPPSTPGYPPRRGGGPRLPTRPPTLSPTQLVAYSARIVRAMCLRLPLALHGCVRRDAGVWLVSCVGCACVAMAASGYWESSASASGVSYHPHLCTRRGYVCNVGPCSSVGLGTKVARCGPPVREAVALRGVG